VIETLGVTKAYGKDEYAVRDLSIKVEKGEFAFLTGPSGAGKSTLLRLLLLQERPTEGQIIIEGRDLQSLTPSEVQAYRRMVGFVFQDFKLIPTKTVFENVAFRYAERARRWPQHSDSYRNRRPRRRLTVKSHGGGRRSRKSAAGEPAPASSPTEDVRGR
jgi:ABC-type ATPase involved in cell division